MLLSGFLVAAGCDDERSKLGFAPAELQQTTKILAGNSSGFYFNRPLPPTALNDCIDFEGFLTPLHDPLSITMA